MTFWIVGCISTVRSFYSVHISASCFNFDMDPTKTRLFPPKSLWKVKQRTRENALSKHVRVYWISLTLLLTQLVAGRHYDAVLVHVGMG
jgi:hypothetical protein